MRNFFRNIQLTNRFFLGLASLVVLFCLSFPYPSVLGAVKALMLIFTALVVADTALLFGRRRILIAKRHTPALMSLGDDNPITIKIRNVGFQPLRLTVYDEVPSQFQLRTFAMKFLLGAGNDKTIKYDLNPKTRGEYHFGIINVMSTSVLGFVSRRNRLGEEVMVPVFPSIIQMKKFELQAFARISNFEGIKKVRRLGHSYEFEQIKQYVQGDDIRSINWKATGRRNNLMVNQYEDERAQQIYSIIDKSRSMRMPFNGLSLLDYAVNTSLVISNIALKKHDKAGLITYSNKIGSTIKAERSRQQLKKILHALYNEKEHILEANYQLLYHAVKNVIKSRSLIFLYLNFESIYALDRALPMLKKINHNHLLVCMIFENTELEEYIHRDVELIQDIYTKTIAHKLLLEKKHLVLKLRKHGIQTILTRPEDLSMNTVNKYLELKSKGLI